MPGKRLVADFKMNTTLKCVGLSFSRDGKYLVIIGGLPDFNITIYDLENKKFLITESQTLKYQKEFICVKFNPRTRNEFAILSQHKVQFYTIIPAFQYREGDDGAYNEGDSDGGSIKFIDAWRFDVQEFCAMDVPADEGTDGRIEFTAMTWDRWNRILLCTNQKKLFHVNSKNPHIGKTLELDSQPLSTVITPKHLLVSQANGMIYWFKIEDPFENAKPEEQFITIYDEIDKEFDFIEKLPRETASPANYILYSKSHQNLLIGTSNGYLTLLNVPAEQITEGDEEQEQEEVRKQMTLLNELRILGRFHTARVNDVKPLGKTTQMVSCSQDNTVNLWEVTTMQILSVIDMPVEPVSLAVSKAGSVVFIGTAIGTFRCYNVVNREKPRLIHQLKFYEDECPISSIIASEDGRLVLISSKESDIFFVMSQDASTGFDIFGQIRASGHILSIGFYINEGNMCALALLSNNLVECYELPVKVYAHRLEPMPQSMVHSAVRKVDVGSDMIITGEFFKQYFVLGDDNVLKFYEHYPTDTFDKIDWKKPAVKPAGELTDSHSIAATVSVSN